MDDGQLVRGVLEKCQPGACLRDVTNAPLGHVVGGTGSRQVQAGCEVWLCCGCPNLCALATSTDQLPRLVAAACTLRARAPVLL